MFAITSTSFELLLSRLDKDDPSSAAERYETLRMKLVRTLVWKGCPESEADSLADTVLDRVAAKLESGIEIRSINSYSLEVLRFVHLEYRRRHREEAVGDEEMPVVAVGPEHPEDPDDRLRCLRKCLGEVVPNDRDRKLITGYYDLDAGDKLKNIRKQLADSLGMTMVNLKVRACRLRDRLERCIGDCADRVYVTKTAGRDTKDWGDPAR